MSSISKSSPGYAHKCIRSLREDFLPLKVHHSICEERLFIDMDSDCLHCVLDAAENALREGLHPEPNGPDSMLYYRLLEARYAALAKTLKSLITKVIGNEIQESIAIAKRREYEVNAMSEIEKEAESDALEKEAECWRSLKRR